MDISQIMGLMGPAVGFGGATGLVVGYTAKKITKFFALLLGCCFILLQLAAYFGLITVHWGVVEGTAMNLWNGADGLTLVDRLRHILVDNLPFGGGFVAGFAIGLKFG